MCINEHNKLNVSDKDSEEYDVKNVLDIKENIINEIVIFIFIFIFIFKLITHFSATDYSCIKRTEI